MKNIDIIIYEILEIHFEIIEKFYMLYVKNLETELIEYLEYQNEINTIESIIPNNIMQFYNLKNIFNTYINLDNVKYKKECGIHKEETFGNIDFNVYDNLTLTLLESDSHVNMFPDIPDIPNREEESPNSIDSNLSKRLNHYIIMHPIGTGSSCQVYLALDELTNELYATKIIKCSNKKFSTTFFNSNIKKEIAIMRKLNCKHIIKLKDAIYDIENHIIYLIMPYLEKGQILKINYKTCSTQPLEKNKMTKYISQIIKGLIYLHTCNIVHRDIKPENILLDNNDNIVIIDFGVSLMMNDEKDKNKMEGTYYYMSPEVITYNTALPESDIWSLGVIIYLMTFGYFPFIGNNEYEIKNNIVEQELKIPECTDDIRELLLYTLCKDYKKRITLRKMLELKFFGFNNTYNRQCRRSIDNFLVKNETIIEYRKSSLNNDSIIEHNKLLRDKTQLNTSNTSIKTYPACVEEYEMPKFNRLSIDALSDGISIDKTSINKTSMDISPFYNSDDNMEIEDIKEEEPEPEPEEPEDPEEPDEHKSYIKNKINRILKHRRVSRKDISNAITYMSK